MIMDRTTSSPARSLLRRALARCDLSRAVLTRTHAPPPESLFVLSTRTMQWFVERGFGEVAVDELPAARRAAYDAARRSRVYMKTLMSQRALDAEELFWASDVE